jgi:hypothetical protein
MWELRQHALEHDDLPFYFAESGAKDTSHPVDFKYCWAIANPALDDFLARDSDFNRTGVQAAAHLIGQV